MKKVLVFAFLLLCTALQAQLVVNTFDGGTIEDGEAFTYNSLAENQAKLRFTVTNTGTEEAYVKVRVDEITNASGGQVQLCFGVCVYNINEGNLVPNFILPIPAGTTTESTQDHFWNANPGNGVDPVQYAFTFIEIDENGAYIADVVSFTYTYIPTAGTDDFAGLQNIGITVKNTVVKNNLDVEIGQPATMELYSVNGQLIKTAALSAGSQAIDLSALSAAVYIARFTNDKNQTSQIRIVKN